MRLRQLTIKNFKGLGAFNISMNGADTSIYGDNATGKTTIFDAFTWLLFGKDSLTSAVFEIKPKGSNGVETEVEAVLELAPGDEKTLKKVYSEKWVKRRGATKAEFTGHQIDHFIDGVPSKKKEFDAAIAEICPEDLFRVLTNPKYFNEVLHWQERRKTLLTVCGEITEADVIAADPQLAKLPGILGKHSVDDYRKIVKARLPEINRELQKIPVRIDEASGSMAETRDEETVRSEFDAASAERKHLADQIYNIENGGELAASKRALAEAETALISHDNKTAAANRKEADAAEQQRSSMRHTAANLEKELFAASNVRERLLAGKKEINERIKTLEEIADKLRGQWHQENARLFEAEFDQPDTCPSCGQPLPAERLEQTQANALDTFNFNKAARLKDINRRGKEANEESKEQSAALSALFEKIEQIDTDINTLETDRAAVLDTIGEETGAAEQPVEDPVREELEAKISAIKSDIAALREGARGDIEKVRAGAAMVDASIEQLQREQLQIDANYRIEKRIEELKAQERDLAAEYERLEGHLYLTEQFIRSKVQLFEEKINSKFKIASWRLFEEQINGGLAECCTMTVDGVGYGSINSAARINAGVEVCNVLSEYHGIVLPIFCDNAESVSELLPSLGQQIRLIVSPEDKTLRVE